MLRLSSVTTIALAAPRKVAHDLARRLRPPHGVGDQFDGDAFAQPGFGDSAGTAGGGEQQAGAVAAGERGEAGAEGAPVGFLEDIAGAVATDQHRDPLLHRTALQAAAGRARPAPAAAAARGCTPRRAAPR
jgi:hypothetical protein